MLNSWLTPANIMASIALAMTVWSYYSYCWVVWRGESDSNAVTWLVLSILLAIQFVSQARLGGVVALTVSASQTIGVVTVLLVTACRYVRTSDLATTGLGKYIGPVAVFDWCMLAIAMAVTMGCYLTSSPELGVALSLVADAAGMIPTVRMAFNPRDGLPLFPWWLDVFAGLFGVGAVVAGDGLQVELMALPIYITTINLVVITSFYVGRRWRRRVTQSLATA
jgi:hypothetical protein